MTDEEKIKIKDCNIFIKGPASFISEMKIELKELGFIKITEFTRKHQNSDYEIPGILIVHDGDRGDLKILSGKLPIILSFDLIFGAAGFVIPPEEDLSWLVNNNLRLWVVEYMSGYCSFWNLEGWDWLHEALPEIAAERCGGEGLKTAVHLCARIAANIAVGRDVKLYPRFYLVNSGE